MGIKTTPSCWAEFWHKMEGSGGVRAGGLVARVAARQKGVYCTSPQGLAVIRTTADPNQEKDTQNTPTSTGRSQSRELACSCTSSTKVLLIPT